MEYHINFIKIFLLVAILALYTKAKDIELSIDQLTSISQKIYQNECGGNLDKLLFWSEYESFASVGIGHFIWYPKGIKREFDESFPKLLDFMQHRGINIPDWLKEDSSNPWRDKKEMLSDPRSKELRDFLQHNISIQALFLAKRINSAMPKIIDSIDSDRGKKILKAFNLVAKEENGYYLLIDYVNFKGEGIKESERYKDQGWGLLQVLECMDIETKSPKAEFAKCAKKTLLRRVENSPKELNEKRWLKGWFNRIDTYLY